MNRGEQRIKNKELIKELLKYDLDLEVVISDGYRFLFYHTHGIKIEIFQEDDETVLDIGIGGCEIKE